MRGFLTRTSCRKVIDRIVIASLIILEIYLVDFVRPIRQIYSGFGSPETDRCEYGPNGTERLERVCAINLGS